MLTTPDARHPPGRWAAAWLRDRGNPLVQARDHRRCTHGAPLRFPPAASRLRRDRRRSVRFRSRVPWIVWQFEWLGNVDTIWEYRPFAEWFGGLASFSRLILHDRRGTGASSAPSRRSHAEDDGPRKLSAEPRRNGVDRSQEPVPGRCRLLDGVPRPGSERRLAGRAVAEAGRWCARTAYAGPGAPAMREFHLPLRVHGVLRVSVVRRARVEVDLR